MRNTYFLAVLLMCLLGGAWHTADGQVRVTKQAAGKSMLDLSGLKIPPEQEARLFHEVLQQDLRRSGWFVLGRGAAGLNLVGTVRVGGDEIEVRCRLQRAGEPSPLLSKSYEQPLKKLRELAHRVADDIVAAATGHRGFASGRLVMVGTATGHKELYVCGADGRSLMQLTHDATVSVGPKWGPEGRMLVYTSYLKGFPDVYLVDTRDGSRRRVSNEAGLNTGAALSPDGRSVALILSRDGNPELYIKRLRTGRLVRLTRTSRAVEASPAWSPDGSRLVYVSDAAGRPHLYTISRRGGQPQRLTSRGLENVDPDWGRNGLVAYASRRGGRYVICLMNPDTGEDREVPVPDYADYEDPSWAPDGRHLACTRTAQYRSQVYLLDTAGDPPVPLTDYKGDWYSPSWAPE